MTDFDRERGFVRQDDIPREEDESAYEKAVQKLTRRFESRDDDLESRAISYPNRTDEDRSRSQEDDSDSVEREEETVVISRSDAINRMITDEVRERTNQLREDEKLSYIDRVTMRDDDGKPVAGTRYSVVGGVAMAYDYHLSKDGIDVHDDYRLARDDEMAALQRKQEEDREDKKRAKEFDRSILSIARDDDD